MPDLTPLPEKQTGIQVQKLVGLMQRLLAPDGCPWDREQTLETLVPYLVEETYEVVDALAEGTGADHRGGVGGRLMQSVFQSGLPFPDAHFDLVTSAFGFRNLANYDAGLQEIMRILRPGGEFGILDFGEPEGLVGNCYRLYFKSVLPAVGTLVSGVKGPYAYLPASVARFPAPDEMLQRILQTGFGDSSWTPYTLGIAGLYRGKK
mgnify:CR=1 FL=1